MKIYLSAISLVWVTTHFTSNLCIFFFGYQLNVSSNQTLDEEIACESRILVNKELMRKAYIRKAYWYIETERETVLVS